MAENASKAKRDFMATMSHELPTSINGIIDFADLILTTDHQKAQREYLQGCFEKIFSQQTIAVIVAPP